MEGGPANEGTIAAVRGSVVDASFPSRVPPLYDLLESGNMGRRFRPPTDPAARR